MPLIKEGHKRSTLSFIFSIPLHLAESKKQVFLKHLIDCKMTSQRKQV